MAAPSKVDLGFVERIDSWKLASHFFPSKVGGKPAWLSLKNLPASSTLTCPNCKNPLVFVLQIYAPVEENPMCFHRTIFLFVCKEAACQKENNNSNLKVFRCQLSRENEFYSSEPPDEGKSSLEDNPSANKLNDICEVCGCLGPKKCGRCQKVFYCSKEHQTIHWKSGHKNTCGKDGSTDEAGSRALLFPELELVIEEEPVELSKSEEGSAAEYEELLKENTTDKGSGGEKALAKDLKKLDETKTDEQFLKFKNKIEAQPDQVLRYNKGGEPLWVSDQGIPSEDDIPPCSCGAPRQFEFQILPQLLNELQVDKVNEKSLDWGTLAVFTCRDSCEKGQNTYHEEFVWKQDFTMSS